MRPIRNKNMPCHIRRRLVPSIPIPFSTLKVAGLFSRRSVSQRCAAGIQWLDYR
jgi:hypothetical protein